jgi:hypothetical protein
MDLLVGTKGRFNEPYRPSQVRWGAIGGIVNMEERRTTFGPASFVPVPRFHHIVDRGVIEAGELRLIPRSPSGLPR